MKYTSLSRWAQLAGSIAVVVGSLLHFFDSPAGKYIFGAGALILILQQLVFYTSIAGNRFSRTAPSANEFHGKSGAGTGRLFDGRRHYTLDCCHSDLCLSYVIS